MENVRKADPSFVNFKPRTAVEAVDRFSRCRKNGLKGVLVPECLIECSRHLPETELDLFEDWILNPGGLNFSNVVPDDSLRKCTAELFELIASDHAARCGPNELPAPRMLPPVPPVPPVPDEKQCSLL